MALQVYVPDFLDREEQAYFDAFGNYQIDYRANGDTPTVGSKTILGVPYKLKDSSFTRDLNVYPITVPTGVSHVSGVDEDWRSTNFDVVVTSTLCQEDFTLGFFGSDILEVEYLGDGDYKIVGYHGYNSGKTAANLFEYTEGVNDYAIMFPMDVVETPVTVGIIDTLTLNSLKIDSRWPDAGVTTSFPHYPLDFTLRNTGDFYVPVPAGLTEEDMASFKEFLVVKSIPDTRVNIEPISKIVTSDGGVTWTTTNASVLSPTVTNYKTAAENDHTLTVDTHLLGYSGTLAQNTGVIFNISITSLRPHTYNYTPSYKKYPTFNLYVEPEALRVEKSTPYMQFTRAGENEVYLGRDTDGTKVYMGSLGNSTDPLDDLWDSVVDINGKLLESGAKSAITLIDGNFVAVKFTGDPEIIGVTNSSYIPTVSGPLAYIPNNTDDNKLSFPTAFHYDGPNTAYSLDKDSTFNFLLSIGEGVPPIANDRVYLPTVTSDILPVEFSYYLGDNDATSASITYDPIRTPGYNARKLAKLLSDDLDFEDIFIFFGTTDAKLIIRNMTDSLRSFTITNIFDVFKSDSPTNQTNYNGGFIMPSNVGENIFGILNVVTEELPYNATYFLDGKPVSLKIGGYNPANDFHLKLIISDNPDAPANTVGSFINNSDKNLNILVNKINQYTRQVGVLSSVLNTTTIALYQAIVTGSFPGEFPPPVIDVYLYGGSATTAPFKGSTECEADLPLDANKRYTGLGENTSKEFWYFEEGIKQPILLESNVISITPAVTYMQIVPGASDTQLVLKVENNLSTYDYSLLTVTLPAYSGYSTPAAWYTTLAASINSAIEAEIGAGTIVVDNHSATYNTAMGHALRFTNNATGELRQFKVGVEAGSSVTLVKLDSDTSAVPEFVTTDIFPEFSGTTPNRLSFWMG